MKPEVTATIFVKAIGYLCMLIATYHIGGGWWMMFLIGLVAWLPTKYFK